MSVMTVDVNTDIHQAYRFPAWVALFVFSAVCLAAITSTTEDRTGREKWVVAVSCISMILAFCASLSYLFVRPKFVGKSIEVWLALIIIVLWCAGWPVIMNTDNAIAVTSTLTAGLFIINANLYFFTWLALAAALFIAGSIAQERSGLSLVPSATQARWLGLAAASIIVMASAARVLRADTCQLDIFSDSAYCRRTRWAVGLGCISTVISIFVLFASRCFTLLLNVEFAITSLLLVLWCFGVGFITFGNTPGATISNIYFGAWIAFIVTVFLFAYSFREFMAARAEDAENSTADTKTKDDDKQAGKKDAAPQPANYKIDDSDEDDEETGAPPSPDSEVVEVTNVPLKDDTDEIVIIPLKDKKESDS